MPAPTSDSASNPPLYSQRSVRFFSLLFSAVAGGVLTAGNLQAVGRPEQGRKVIWASVVYTAAMAVLVSFLPASSPYGAYAAGIGLAGGYGLNTYADSFIPNKQDYPARSIWRPLLLCLLVFGSLLALLIYAL
ncbi:hypothetical protein [Hymenobacter actinosclerus]|uniref:Uncharacterized protein n=1 Tax=Hymenobacter actinosclerus TaxID=82805 RepID=A0A1I0BNY2_9BACT|nr:hypothetical protein [Hymenobacter actinosclerus]SET08581.1 hypothetical protein SAMN04487998_1140 [Hymenobacter actinosclerus]